MKNNKFKQKLTQTIIHLKKKKKILLITTSNRWVGDKEDPKSTLLAKKIAQQLNEKTTLLDVAKIKIYPCEGNVSTSKGNSCGEKSALLNDPEKNPSRNHRCWASINNPDDELWKVSKALFESDTVIFFASIRWGQTNSIYQKLLERLTWIENMHSTFGEENKVKKIEAGIIATGQNWNGKKVIRTQKEVLKYFGFKVNEKLCWNWQYTTNTSDETNESYKKSWKKFNKTFFE